MNNNTNLNIIPFGGVGKVTKNMFVYQYKDDILVVDCGVGFPDEPSPKESFAIPDFSYLLKNKDKIKGLIITHAHFDHYGAVPNLLSLLNVPIYTSRLAAEFIKSKLPEFGIKQKHVDFRLIDKNSHKIRIGAFELTPFLVNHSVPQSLGLFLKMPVGNIFHVSDFKFDFTPIDEDPFDIQKLSRLASLEKPVLLLSDCLGAAKKGHTKTEATIQQVLENIMIRVPGLVLVTTISTNISRIKQTIKAAANTGRKVAFIGRSLEESSRIAKMLGYLANLGKTIIPAKKIKRNNPANLVLIVAGCYGQENSALSKISQNKHQLIKLKAQDAVVFSADPSPPGVIVSVNNVIDSLSKMGVRVYYYEIQDNLHVSGHGTAEDIKMLISIIKPKFLMPIGGNFRHMYAYSLLAQKMRYKENQVLLLNEKQKIAIINNNQIIIRN